MNNKIYCTACNRGSLIRTKKYFIGGMIVLAWYVFLIPYLLDETVFMISAGSALTASAFIAPALLSGFFLIGGIVTGLLVMKKSVLECNVCKNFIVVS